MLALLPLIVYVGLFDQIELDPCGPLLIICDQTQVGVAVRHLAFVPCLNHPPGLLRAHLLLRYHNQQALGLALRTVRAPKHLVDCVRLETRAVSHDDAEPILRHL